MDYRKYNNIWDKVAVNFGRVGPGYWNVFGNRLVELASIENAARVLDIGMGRGSSLYPIIKRVGENGHVIGIDSSEVMVSETYKEILSKQIFNTEVKVMNGETLDFMEKSFDNVICGFGIGFLLQNDSKLKGVLRVLKNGGQAGFSIWGQHNDQQWFTKIIDKYLLVGSKDKSPGSLKFDTIDAMIRILHDSNFHNIKVLEENADIIYKDKEEWWQEMCANAVSAIFEQLENQGREVFDKFKQEVFEELGKRESDIGICFKMSVIYAFGEKQI